MRHMMRERARTRDRTQFNDFSCGQGFLLGEMRRQHNAWVAIVPSSALCETPKAMILGNYIDGRWIAPRAGATFEKRNPADDREI